MEFISKILYNEYNLNNKISFCIDVEKKEIKINQDIYNIEDNILKQIVNDIIEITLLWESKVKESGNIVEGVNIIFSVIDKENEENRIIFKNILPKNYKIFKNHINDYIRYIKGEIK